MKELISAARIGRSLGVHLILATQKPSGQVNEQIWSNSKFKLCLKVQNKEDSNEVLKSPLAAEIREPGRAYLQVGNNEIFELFQSGFSGALEKASDTNEKEYIISEVDFGGHRKELYRKKKIKNTEGSRTQLEALVEYINKFCVKEAIMKKTAMEHCAERFVLCDSSKFSQYSCVKFGEIANAVIITTEFTKEILGDEFYDYETGGKIRLAAAAAALH